MSDFSQAFGFLTGPWGVIFLALIITVGGMRKWWVWGWVYIQAREDFEKRIAERDTALETRGKEADEWRTMFLEAADLSERSVGLMRGRSR